MKASVRYSQYEQRQEYVRRALASGRFVWQERGSRIRCTFCGRTGYSSGYWLDNCLKGHPFVCGCGRVFSSKQAIATHRRHWRAES